jgi:hypothetical protein
MEFEHGTRELGSCIRRSIGAIASIVLSIGLAACSSAGDEAEPAGPGESAIVDLETLKLASVKLDNGNEVGWYELAPGSVALRETVAYPTEPLLDAIAASASPAELFRQLAPNAVIPQRLLAAVERSRELDEAGDLSDFEAVDVEAGELRAETASTQIERAATIAELVESGGLPTRTAALDDACPWSWFKSQCDICATGPCGDWQVSWPNRTGSSSFSRKGYMTAIAICPYRGSVHQVIKLRGNVSRDAVRQPGVAVRWFLNNGSHKFTASSSVDQADGDGYHHCGEGSW